MSAPLLLVGSSLTQLVTMVQMFQVLGRFEIEPLPDWSYRESPKRVVASEGVSCYSLAFLQHMNRW